MVEREPARFDRALATELDAARGLLEELAVQLCLDPVVFERHGEALQAFDRLAQVIGEVAAVLRHDGPRAAAVDVIRLDDLRERLVRCDVSVHG